MFYQVLAFSIRKSDMDLRKTLYSNIVLSGGSTLYRGIKALLVAYLECERKLQLLPFVFVSAGFGDRLLAEVKKLTPKDIKIRVSSSFVLQWLYTTIALLP